ncbi:MAG: type II secretion system minor pseudopilin GspJ [Halopseudomonas yangmingensis]|uniref:Type II secretion system protein J n=1 Tax=Halopseudomonas yangmingensis TaxID=1720063 RepID=A0A1I4U6U9_9GAMM|nr:type II secretion system minor pseudopilin GspJ [Halopseudomonas yangmingensis]SFM84702.1 general secretion pathway protein J [Halopseudomonas yangmingensis]
MTHDQSGAQRGFTLMEVLIALVVFTLMSVMAYQGLHSVLQSEQVTREQARRLADLQVTLSVLERDLAQVVSRPVRDEFGDWLPPLRLRAGGDARLLELVRAGAGGSERLRRSAWLVSSRGLQRQLWPGVDIADADASRIQPLAELTGAGQTLGLDSGFVFIVRGSSGFERVDSWPPPGVELAEAGLPLAVEVVLELPDLGVIRRLIKVGL